MTACVASSSIRKGRFLKVTSSLHVAECLPGEDWVGVSLNAASTGQAVTIVGPGGFADVRAGAAITAGDELEIIQLGSVAPLASGDKCGIALSTAAGNGSRVQVAVLPKQASGSGGVELHSISVFTDQTVPQSVPDDGNAPVALLDATNSTIGSGVFSFAANAISIVGPCLVIAMAYVTWEPSAAGGTEAGIIVSAWGGGAGGVASGGEFDLAGISDPPIPATQQASPMLVQFVPVSASLQIGLRQNSGDALDCTYAELSAFAIPATAA